MHLVERRNKIIESLEKTGSIQVTKLASQLAISEVTIRNDLKFLEDKGVLVRFHGGATLPEKALPIGTRQNSPLAEIRLEERVNIAQDPKRRIAIHAAKMVQSGDSVILDSGSTTLNVAEELAKKDGITVLTNNLPAALALSSNKEITLVVCGGTFRHKTRSFHGTHTESVLQGVTSDILFIGADGIDSINGISTFNEGYAISDVMANAAKKVVAVLDSSKFGRSGFNLVLPIAKINSLITDDGISDEDKNNLIRAGIEVIVV